MLRLSRLMPAWESIPQGGAAGTAILRCPIGLTYHQLYTEYTNLTLAEITQIRVNVNGEILHKYDSGTQLDAINQFDRRTAAGGILCIDFDRHGLRDRLMEELSSLGTGHRDDPTPITHFNIEFDIDTAAATPTLQSRAEQSLPRPAGIVRRFRTFPYDVAGAGDFEISTLPKGDVINRIFFSASANVIERVVIERDNFKVHDRTAALNTRIQADGVRTAQAGYYVYDPTELGNGKDQLTTRGVNDLRFRLTVDGAMTLVAAVDYFGALKSV